MNRAIVTTTLPDYPGEKLRAAVDLVESVDRKQIVQAPENCHDDLAPRWNIDDAELQRLRRNHVLYDEAANGRHVQHYARLLDGLFVEVVQQHGYATYGESNSAARIAAAQRDFDAVAQTVTIGPGADRR